MEINHSYSSFTYRKRRIEALWSFNPNGKLLIFIHGFKFFGNSPTDSWNHFISYIPYHTEFNQCDVLFFGYDSRHTINESSTTFKEFIKDFVLERNKYIRKNVTAFKLVANIELRYSKIIIIAHSMGALISRCSINELFLDEPNIANICHFILFAPAHNGENTVDFYESLARELKISIFASILKRRYLSIPDLKRDSLVITGLKETIQNLLAKGINSFTIAEKIIWSRLDYVVFNEKFLMDAKPIRLDLSHTQINKPFTAKSDSIVIVKGAI